ncbi:MAG: hypothetical protein RIB30_13470 [Thalassospira sp.]|uniref:hypothetical protein n=2 Tax=Thalassospira sp. TaxID=1912094 RepID=UPI0032EDA8B4
MQELEITDGRIVRIWWLLTWRTFAGAMIGGIVIGFAASFVIGIINETAGRTILERGFIVSLLEMFWMFIWQFFVIKMMLRKRYNGFRLAIIADDPSAATEPETSPAQPEL